MVLRKTPVKKKTPSAKSRSRVVTELLQQVEARLKKTAIKPTVAEYIRLVQLQKELEENEPRDITVMWVEEKKTDPESDS
jgi:hypothetical protein